MNVTLRAVRPEDREEIAELICASLNCWYQAHGGAAVFPGGPADADVFFEIYNTLEPGHCVVAEDPATGRLAGSCFFHPRPTHVSLGIMNVHPEQFGRGVGSALLRFITDFTDRGNFPALRLISSAGNLDSFSLYNRAGFVPRAVFQDMVVRVPETGLDASVPGIERVRSATAGDADAMAALELAVSGVHRGADYAFCIANRNGFWRASVYEAPSGAIEGYMVSSGHHALNILGPAVASSEEVAAALLLRELDHHRGRSPLLLLPVDRPKLIRLACGLGARNVELHLCQVRGSFQPFRGVVMPTFLLETA
ncbi:MAG TPA: GNAT family N-acetyltransferase [Bryobacteraceae bacterium]|nr:GNAT family N-acetyltransferase [Bryobacteraceae bacterium]